MSGDTRGGPSERVLRGIAHPFGSVPRTCQDRHEQGGQGDTGQDMQTSLTWTYADAVEHWSTLSGSLGVKWSQVQILSARPTASSARTAFDGARLAEAARIEKAAFTRADLVEILGAQLSVDTDRSPRELVGAAVDEIGVRLSAPRAALQREGHERFTLDRILAEEAAVLDLVDAREDRALLWVKDEDTAGLSADQACRGVRDCALTVADPTPVRAGGGGQDHLHARAAHRGAPPPSTAPSLSWHLPGRRSTSRCAKAPAMRG